MSIEQATKEVHVLSHTHWDREWYKPFQEFRYYLVQVIDQVLDLLESDPEYRYFHLDGQTVVLEDYVEIRPERADELRRRIREGRILIGPWYDLADLFLVDGESLVRNFQLGIRLCREWGAEPMPLGYSIDLFGHSSQMPQLFAGFGIEAATLFRGVTAEAAGSEFIWVGPDGTECLVFRLCDNKAYSNFWYTFLPMLTHREPYSEQEVRKGLEEILSETEAQTAMPYLLFLDGVDHITANPRTTHIIRDANQIHDGYHFIHSNWVQFMDKAVEYLRENNVDLTRIHGELRLPNQSGRLNRVTPDVSSSRIHLKIQNKVCETSMLRWFEPLRAIARALGFDHPAGFLMLAWRYLLKNHPHDSICGCSVDQVHEDMEYRFRQVEGIARRSIEELLSEIGARADTTCVEPGETGILVFNPSQHARDGILRLSIETSNPEPAETFALLSPDGRELPYQLLEKRTLKNRIAYQPITGATHAAGATRLELAVDAEVPALGYSVIRLHEKRWPATSDKRVLSETPGVMENERLRVEIRPDGRVDVLHKATARWFRGLHNFEDCGEVGDLWVHKKPPVDTLVRGIKHATVSLIHNGPLLATYRVAYTLELPLGAVPDHSARSRTMGEMTVVSDFTLTRSAAFLSVETSITNTIRDHRLRVTFPSDCKTDVHHASSQFDVVQRSIRLLDTHDWLEEDSEIKPTQGFVDVSDGVVGLGLLTFGLPEYAVIDDERRTLALTLLRALGQTVGTEGEEGPQCLHEIRYRYAIAPHAGDWKEAGLYRLLDEHNLALRTLLVTPHGGSLLAGQSFIDIQPPDLVLSSFRNPFGDSTDAVLRVFNPTEQSVTGHIRLGLPVAKAWLCDLNDEPEGELAPRDNSLEVTLGPKKIRSIRLQFA